MQANSLMELKQVLTQLGGMTSDDVIAFELLWTPQVCGRARMCGLPHSVIV